MKMERGRGRGRRHYNDVVIWHDEKKPGNASRVQRVVCLLLLWWSLSSSSSLWRSSLYTYITHVTTFILHVYMKMLCFCFLQKKLLLLHSWASFFHHHVSLFGWSTQAHIDDIRDPPLLRRHCHCTRITHSLHYVIFLLVFYLMSISWRDDGKMTSKSRGSHFSWHNDNEKW